MSDPYRTIGRITFAEALAAGDGTLHGAIDHWQERALKAEAERDAARALLRETNEMLAEAIVCGPKLRKYMPLRQRIVAALRGQS